MKKVFNCFVDFKKDTIGWES